MPQQYNILYSKSFECELISIVSYIGFVLNNRQAATDFNKLVTKAIFKRSFKLSAYEPALLPGLSAIYYRIYVNNYVIYYSVENDNMFVEPIFYAKRNIPKLL